MAQPMTTRARSTPEQRAWYLYDWANTRFEFANTATLLAYSGHTSVDSLARSALVSPEALARWQARRDPAARRR